MGIDKVIIHLNDVIHLLEELKISQSNINTL